MGSKSQRKKEQHAKKRAEKKKKLQQAAGGRQGFQNSQTAPEFVAIASQARHRQRLLEQVPRAWPGETPVDVAMFDDSVLATLPDELAMQVTAVRSALEDVCESRGEDAFKRTSGISFGSPLSEWRLFLRGLTNWLENDSEAANEAWKRLDPERRPGRIAASMMVALSSDLEVSTGAPSSGGAGDSSQALTLQGPSWSRWDQQSLYHARLLRRVRIDRAAIRIAEAGLKVPEESPVLYLGPNKRSWVRRFVAEFQETEPDLVSAVSQVALGRAFAQKYTDLFDEAAKSIPGPRHDRRNLLLTYFYYTRSADNPSMEAKAEQALDDYLNIDLPANDALSAPLRRAIASQIHLEEALAEMRPSGNRMAFLFDEPEDSKEIRKQLRASVKAEPANRPAHKAYVSWIESQLGNDRITKAKREALDKELVTVMQDWSRGLPNDVDPRLWLVDHLLEDEQLEAARPHVDFLAASRHEDPRVRATPWKWQLLEAMRLCRRKIWLADAPARLDEAEELWPVWMSKKWLPYLRAAWALRSGNLEAFEQQRRLICEESGRARDSLADACMMLGAAQRMRASADEIKRLRVPVDEAVKSLKAVPLEDLIDAAGFFWDLHRVQLLYPAYRMHGGKFGKALIDAWAKNPQLVLDNADEPRIHKAVLWTSEHRFWSTNYEVKVPSWSVDRDTKKHPIFVAARLNAFLKSPYHWGPERYRDLGPVLREAASSQRDVYYRYWFASMADELDDVFEDVKSRSFGSPFDMFARFGAGGASDADDDDFDELGYDPTCNCANCRAARQAAGISQ